jgi:glycosyltransferase involved in cell wall biosynthesis
MSQPRLAVICDYPEEAWPSMDLCAEMLLNQLQTDNAPGVQANRVCPPFRHRLSRLPLVGKRRVSHNADRLLNRFWDYPRHLRRRVREFDLFHLCDHSYAQLVRVLPAERTGVFCHDLDTFRCLLEPRSEHRPRWFRHMMRSVLAGLQRAAIVFYSTAEVRAQIERHGLLAPDRLVQAPYGTAPEFTPVPDESCSPQAALPRLADRPYLLHVGSCIPRKRIDVLLAVFAGVRARHPDLMLVQVGGSWTPAHEEQIRRLGLAEALVQVRGLDRRVIAGLYRAARLVLQPSEAEGFGLPVVEALACGSMVVASDIPVLREVGGSAVLYCPVADVAAWADTVCHLLKQPGAAPGRVERLAQAQRYSWSAQAQTIVAAYERLLQTA